MRDDTERPEGVIAGTARLVGTNESEIFHAVTELLHDPESYGRMSNSVNPYGDGHAAERTVLAMTHHVGLGPPAEEFGVNLGSLCIDGSRSLGAVPIASDSDCAVRQSHLDSPKGPDAAPDAASCALSCRDLPLGPGCPTVVGSDEAFGDCGHWGGVGS